MGEIGRRKFRSTAVVATLVAVAAICVGLTVVAQSPPTLPGQVGQQTVQIMGTAHDFADGAGPGQDTWLGAGDNMCTPCHGVPGVGGSAPTWNHTYDNGTTYDDGNWMYTKHDAVTPEGGALSTFDDLSKKCLGCHDGLRTLQNYTGYVQPYSEPTGVTGAITAFASGGGSVTNVTSTAHGLSSGDRIAITGTTNYDTSFNASYSVTVVNVNTFSIAKKFVGDDATGTWEKMDPADDAYVGVDENLGDDLTLTHHPVGIPFTAAMGDAEEYLVNPDDAHYAEGTITSELLTGGLINCNSCHEQHNDRRFDLAGGDYHDDPVLPYTSDSNAHNFLKIYEGGCRTCHTSGSVAAASGSNDHHFPGREDPFGDMRGGNPFNCNMCHKVDESESGHHHCKDCHVVNGVEQIARGGLGNPTVMNKGHHGGDRFMPYNDCAPCHGDPVTGILTGNDFGNVFARSCFECHGNKWAGDDAVQPTWGTPPVEGIVMVGGKPTLDGTVGESVTFQANATDNEGDPLAYTWSFGDGSQAQFPSFDNVTSHTYEVHNFQPRNKPLNPPYNAAVSVTDGKTPPIFYEFQVRIYEAEEHVADTWAVVAETDGGAGPDDLFNLTLEDHGGALVAVRDDDGGALAYGVEFVGVIFWMELWMDLNDSAFWGVGDMYFGNMTRGVAGADNGADVGSMSGVVFRTDGSVDMFTASGGAPAGGH
ncbi:MAG: PKD domain-containing protein [Planctomycetota bacterium]